MKLSAKEMEGLLIYQAGCLAQKRLARGLKLNHPETVALIASQIQELARDGHSVASLMDEGRQMLGRKQVMEGVGDIIHELQVEATFPDGTKLVTVRYPICREQGDLKLALYGSFLPVPSLDIFEKSTSRSTEDPDLLLAPPGSVYPAREKDIGINQNRNKVALVVRSVCDRPIQVGSHYNFLEANRYLVFDRALAYGKRLNIPSGTSVRFEPGASKTVTLVDIGGKRIVRGGNNLCDGPVDGASLPAIMKKVIAEGFGHETQLTTLQPTPCFMSRFLYARTYGPTVGDKIKLGDTTLVIEVEKDFTVYGDECKLGGGKVLRDGMGQASRVSCNDCLDTVIINCVIVDSAQGIVKADVGIKDGKIVGIGKSGNSDIMDGVTPNMTIGTGTDVIAGEGYILTAGGIDCHIHFICPQLAKFAISAGITTMIGGGTGPTTNSCCTTSSPGITHIRSMIQSTDAFPLNFGFTGKGNTSRTDDLSTELIEQIEAGAIGLKIHEDCGSTPAVIDCALNVAEAYDIQIMIHTDTLNESGCVEDTVKAFKGRTIHTYHTEGAGGGHAPDIISVCCEPNVIPSSTNPTRPYSYNTIDEHLDMLMICHHLDKNLKEDIAFAESRIRAETIAAEDILHDMGAISIISSDSQAMGRVGEVIIRTWQTADKMRKQRGRLPEEKGLNDNFRVLRYISKYTINPAIAQGISCYVGSIEIGKLADLVLWSPAFFGVKPHMILKGGQVAWAVMGNPNASIPTPEPARYRKMFGAYGKSVAKNSYMFVSKLSVERGKVQNYGIGKEIVPISNVRNIKKKDMKFNNFLPKLKVDPETYKVFMAKEQAETEMEDEDSWTELTCSLANSLPLSQRYFLF